jgi:hypothetical protein
MGADARGAPARRWIVDDYLYDVFLSYRHKAPALDWLSLHFYPMLERWLRSAMGREPAIFVDWNIETGAVWPDALRDGLLHSRCMLAVCSPDYFNSAWCLAEWKSFLAREQHLDRGGLVYPLRYFDGDLFPEEAKLRQAKDLRGYNCPEPVFAKTKKYVRLDALVQEICVELASRIEGAPTWQNDWPLAALPGLPAPPIAPLPRLG